MSTLRTETSVKERYAAGAQAQEAELCCPVDYDTQYLKVIPQERRTAESLKQCDWLSQHAA